MIQHSRNTLEKWWKKLSFKVDRVRVQQKGSRTQAEAVETNERRFRFKQAFEEEEEEVWIHCDSLNWYTKDGEMMRYYVFQSLNTRMLSIDIQSLVYLHQLQNRDVL